MSADVQSSELAAAEEAMVNALPDPSRRALVLKQLLSSADAAHELAPNAWAVTLFRDGFRLNVGPVEVLVLGNSLVRANFVGTSGSGPFVGAAFTTVNYRSMPQPQCAFVGTVEEFVAIQQSVQAAHRQFIKRAASTASGEPRKGTAFRRSHCEGLIQYARVLALSALQSENIEAPSVLSFPDIDFSVSVSEGGRQLVSHFKRERKSIVVEAKKAAVLNSTGRLSCEVCGFDFFATYGPLGEGFCEVHHLSPLSASDESVTTTPADLAVLCANCHRVIHRSDPMLSVAELSAVVRNGRP